MGRKQDKQNYLKIQKHHRAIGVPWTDSSFPANDSSIGLQKVDGFVAGQYEDI